MKHIYKTRIYFQDTDAGGIVYHSNYLVYAERARSELLVAMGVSNRKLIEQQNIAFVLRRAEVDFLRSARLDDVVEVQSVVVEMKNASMKIMHTIMREDEVLVKILVQLAVVNATTMTPTRLTPELKEMFKVYGLEEK